MKIFLPLIFLVWGNPVLAAQTGNPPILETNFSKTTFAGGCFFYMQQPFDDLKGVKATIVGYTGGHTAAPNHEEVISGKTGHVEAVEILYDPREITYEKLLDVFWQNIDPTTGNRQFTDIGSQYAVNVFYRDAEEQLQAITSKRHVENSNRFEKVIQFKILPATPFYPAEEKFQNYYKKHPLIYKFYRFVSGRDQYIKKFWFNNKG